MTELKGGESKLEEILESENIYDKAAKCTPGGCNLYTLKGSLCNYLDLPIEVKYKSPCKYNLTHKLTGDIARLKPSQETEIEKTTQKPYYGFFEPKS